MGRACTPGGFKLARQMAIAKPARVTLAESKPGPPFAASPVATHAVRTWTVGCPIGYASVANARAVFKQTWQQAFDHDYNSSPRRRRLLLSAVKAGAFDRLIASGELVVPTP